MNRIKSLVKSAMIGMGFNVSRGGISLGQADFPIEFDEAERAFLQLIVRKRLTMVSHERLWSTMMACKHAVEQEIAGDFVECGVWRGGNALIAAFIFKKYQSRKHVYLFDTFAGMTEPTVQDVATKSGQSAKIKYDANLRDTHNDWCFATLQDVERNFLEFDLLSESIHFVTGDVCETLQEKSNLPHEISVLRLDTDWYESTKMELEVLYPRLKVGGTIIIDDYGHWSGARKATDEFFYKRGGKPFLQYTDHTGRCGIKVDV